MKVSTKGRYGLRAMMDLAANQKDGKPVFLTDIAKRQDISEKYLEHIFAALKTAGLVNTVRGRRGGFLLTKTASEITAANIINTLEGPCTVVDCVSQPGTCSKSESCATREIWGLVGSKIDEVLSGFTLDQLVIMQAKKTKTDDIMYYI
jgi:Rrf2 family transcriptional regulator, cysteine metabolism repressor